MNKKLLNVAMGAALASGAGLAQAAVTVGGHAQVEYYNAEATCGPTAGTPRFAGSSVCSAGSSLSQKGSGLIDNARGRFWIKADEDLGGGLKGIAMYEFSVDTASGGGAFTESNSATPYDTTARGFDARNRQKWVGISGGFGMLTLGNHHGIYKLMGGNKWDPVTATVLEARGNGGQSGSADANRGFAHNGFIQNGIRYSTEKLLGSIATIEVMYMPHDNSTSAGDAGTGNDYQAGVSIKPIKDLEIIAVHSNNKKQPNSANFDQKANKAGVRYTFLKDHKVWFQYEVMDLVNANGANVPTGVGIVGTPVDGTWAWLGYHGSFGNHGVVAQYAKHEKDTLGVAGGNGLETTFYSVAYLYNFSKTTRAHVGYRSTTAETPLLSDGAKVIAAGLRKDF